MTRSELIKQLMTLNPHLAKADLEKIVVTIFKKIADTLSADGRVELRGFGTFGIKVIPERPGRNPKTGEKVMIAQKSKPFFKAGKQLKEKLNIA